jgi:hypothetical protein
VLLLKTVLLWISVPQRYKALPNQWKFYTTAPTPSLFYNPVGKIHFFLLRLDISATGKTPKMDRRPIVGLLLQEHVVFAGAKGAKKWKPARILPK